MYAFEQFVHSVLRWCVDRFVASRSATPALGLGGALAALWLLLAACLLGVVPMFSGAVKGPIEIPQTSGEQTQIVKWATELESQRPAHSRLAEFDKADDAAKAWLRNVLCRSNMGKRETRAAQSWRVQANPEVCSLVERTVIQAPLSIRFGKFGGGLLTVLMLGASALAGAWVMRSLFGVRHFYRRLYTSDYRAEREDHYRRRASALDEDDEGTAR